jgi:hypothetical protein
MHRVAVTGVTLAVILACSVVSAGSLDRRLAQTTGTTQTVTGTVKTTTDDGIVVVGRDTGNTDREWAFVVDAGTRIAGGQGRAARDLRQGDQVTVTYTTRDGKVVAQSVTVSPR